MLTELVLFSILGVPSSVISVSTSVLVFTPIVVRNSEVMETVKYVRNLIIESFVLSLSDAGVSSVGFNDCSTVFVTLVLRSGFPAESPVVLATEINPEEVGWGTFSVVCVVYDAVIFVGEYCSPWVEFSVKVSV